MSGNENPAEVNATNHRDHAPTSASVQGYYYQPARARAAANNFSGSCCLPIKVLPGYPPDIRYTDRVNPVPQPHYKVCYDLNGPPPVQAQNFRPPFPGCDQPFAQQSLAQAGRFSSCPPPYVNSPQFQLPPFICRPVPTQIPNSTQFHANTLPISYQIIKEPFPKYFSETSNKEGKRTETLSLSPERTGTIPISSNRSESSHSSDSSSSPHQPDTQSKKTSKNNAASVNRKTIIYEETSGEEANVVPNPNPANLPAKFVVKHFQTGRDPLLPNMSSIVSKKSNQIPQTAERNESLTKTEDPPVVGNNETNRRRPPFQGAKQTEDPSPVHSKIYRAETDKHFTTGRQINHLNSRAQVQSVSSLPEQQYDTVDATSGETPKVSATIKSRASQPFLIQMNEGAQNIETQRLDIQLDRKKESIKLLTANEGNKRKSSPLKVPTIRQDRMVAPTSKDRWPDDGSAQRTGPRTESEDEKAKPAIIDKRSSPRKNLVRLNNMTNEAEHGISDAQEYAILGLRFTPSKRNETAKENESVSEVNKPKRPSRNLKASTSNSIATGKYPKLVTNYTNEPSGSKIVFAPSKFHDELQNSSSTQDATVSTTYKGNRDEGISLVAMNVVDRKRSVAVEPTTVGLTSQSHLSSVPDLTLQIQLVASPRQKRDTVTTITEGNERIVHRNSKFDEPARVDMATAVDSTFRSSMHTQTMSFNNSNLSNRSVEGLEEYTGSPEKVIMAKLFEAQKDTDEDDKCHDVFSALGATNSQLGILGSLIAAISPGKPEGQADAVKDLLSRIILRPDQIEKLKAIADSSAECLRLPQRSQLLTVPEEPVFDARDASSSLSREPEKTVLRNSSLLLAPSQNGGRLDAFPSSSETHNPNPAVMQRSVEVTETTHYRSPKQDVYSSGSREELNNEHGQNAISSEKKSATTYMSKTQYINQQQDKAGCGANIMDTETRELLATAQRLLDSAAMRLVMMPQLSHLQRPNRDKTNGNYDPCCHAEQRRACCSNHVKDAVPTLPRCLMMALNNIERIINSYRLACAPNSERMCHSPHPYRNIYHAPKRPVTKPTAAKKGSNEPLDKQRDSSRSRSSIQSKNVQAAKYTENSVLVQGLTPQQLLLFRELQANPRLCQLLHAQPKHPSGRVGSSVVESTDNHAAILKEETVNFNLGPRNDPGFMPPSNFVMSTAKAKTEIEEGRIIETRKSEVWERKRVNEIGQNSKQSIVQDYKTDSRITVNSVAKEKHSLQRKSSDPPKDDNVSKQVDVIAPAVMFSQLLTPENNGNSTNAARISEDAVTSTHRKTSIPAVKAEKASNKRISHQTSDKGKEGRSAVAKKSVKTGSDKTTTKKA